jgi:hypothetical protein
MGEESKNNEINKDKRLKNLEKGTWEKGESGNPNGRPLGQRNYATIYKEALIKLAKLNDKSPEELENEIISTGLLNARKGNYAFYKDVLDRLHGQATQKTELTGDIIIKTINYGDSSAS